MSAFVAMLARWASIGFAEIDFSNATLTTMHLSLFVAEGVAIVSWFTVRYNIQIPLINRLGVILDGNVQLVRALWESARGSSLHMWDQHQDGRN